MWRPLLAAATGYVAGTFPSADLAARTATHGDVDLHHTGTGNPGALNTTLTIGKKWGTAVLAADITKGFLAARAGLAIAGGTGSHLAATAAVVGHCYPVWTRFDGGKGVATSVGQVLGTFPTYTPIDFAVAGATAAVPAWKRRTFAATVAGAAAWIIAGVLWWRRGWPTLWGPEPTVALPIAASVSSAVIMIRFLQEGIGEIPEG